ncbi:hypothetical protein [Candidatus Nitrososphaera sp. FF02]|uniref:hypothetical protein n=1 Tax=Candidatus Nitrososphaera sp. FF02 TaxID=3398226 RepID=UPI0039EC20B4
MLATLVTSYMEWESFAPRIGMVPLEKETIQLLLASMSNSQLKDIATLTSTKFANNMLYATGQPSLSGFLDITRIRLQKSGFAFNKFVTDDEIRLIVKHSMGHKWSVFFSSFCSNIVNRLKYPTRTEVMEDMWTMVIDTRKQGIPDRSQHLDPTRILAV